MNTVKLVWYEHRYNELLDIAKFFGVPGKILQL